MKYPAKILLFGEFTLIKDSQGLATPFEQFTCELTFDTDDVLENSTLILEKMQHYISSSKDLNAIIDSTHFQKEIANGLQIRMDIPTGYGLGSSGALTACIYERFAIRKTKNINELQLILGQIESIFHGKSSGLDPLVSYLNQAIWIDEEKHNHQINFDTNFNNEFYMFLIDTGQSRSTAPLVNLFLKKCQDKEFISVVMDKIIPLNNRLIEDTLKKDYEKVFPVFKQLSEMQLHYFSEHILPIHQDIWQRGLDTDEFYLKICGAGGGGFMLGITKEKSKVISNFDEENLIWI